MQLEDGQYRIQGLDVLEICEQFGSPLFIYDADMIRYKYEKMVKAFDGLNCKIKYPVKALSNLSILKLMRKLGAGLDTVSLQEARLGLKAGFQPEEIIFTPNCVSFEEIQEAVSMGLVINIDNISILEQFGHAYGDSVPCCIRFNPHIFAGGNSKIQVGHIDSKFGISVFQRRHVERIVKSENINVVGLHVHTGSDILDARAYLQSANIMFDLAREFEGLEFIDFGSGFKVGYKEGDVTTNVEEIGEQLRTAYADFCKDYGKEIEIWFEPGKYMVSESGYFMMKSNVIKPTPSTVFVGVDSGLNHFIRPMMYGGFHDIFNASNPSGTQRIYTVVGYICETDTFGWDRKLNEVREGDILCLKNAGAYGYSMSSNYNSRFRPAEVMVYEGKAHLIRKRETMDDLMRNQVEIEL
ncbi:diaminopimelate decarboxylase [Pontibacter sp. G13]|uniref:diaminopimelate decarboxylase n=1 Tax=Pontibacter sp. G13 TaxID=3074898 RepID=UPI00288A707F|nr:diaminopimelate decarboxylase [Pontibacter sp. G13]WNJ21524.1 diaminopimelate decarboxylase [Pontibacter sp. G13]